MGNFQKTPLVRSLNELAERRAQGLINLTGKALPASVVLVANGVVTVKFELSNIPYTIPNIKVPLGGAAGSQFIRVPIQTGTKGVVRPTDARLGGMSGLGASNTDLTRPANLGALVFEPIGNVGWPAMEDVNQLELMGQNGALIKSTANKEWYVRLTTSGVTISNKEGTASLAWTGSAWEFKGPVIMNNGLQLNGAITAIGGGVYAGDIHTTGTVRADVDVKSLTIGLRTHFHGGVQTGGGTTTIAQD